MAEMTYRDALRAALIEEMDRDEGVVLVGEDIGVYRAPSASPPGCWIGTAARG
jgi:pyruvate/2-oxoglutarate/acetoin dehydrogenase E1 component